MIILDTNVVSEPLRRDGDPGVVAWLDRHAPETMFLTTTSLAELLFGIAILPDGKRKDGLDTALADLLDKLFGARILPFDRDAARLFARLLAHARVRGRAISMADGQIAAIASVRGFAVATRDTEPFEALGVPVVNPWKDG
ncbi:MAG: type II toxin-antitoxin system VapC family toxin [Rhodothalassiaceae bacterium]